jgi:hypothetical protein
MDTWGANVVEVEIHPSIEVQVQAMVDAQRRVMDWRKMNRKL